MVDTSHPCRSFSDRPTFGIGNILNYDLLFVDIVVWYAHGVTICFISGGVSEVIHCC